MVYSFNPENVCSTEMVVEIEEDIIRTVKITGGCPGNSLGVSNLVTGLKIDDAIKKLKGIRCGKKNTSCPDQLAKGLEKIKERIA